MIDRLREWAVMEPARVREAVRALVLVAAVAFGVAADSELITTIVTLVTLGLSALLQEGVRNNVTPVDDAEEPLNENYVRRGDVDGVY